MNNKLIITVIIIYLIWFCIHFILSDLLKLVQSYLLFRVCKCSKLGETYKFIYQKKYNERNAIYIIMDVYGIKGIFNEFIGSKFEYYLMVTNIIDEVENNKPLNPKCSKTPAGYLFKTF